jgi:UDP-glucose:(heptosyl)LPS alpha-1,3-glucosyltransferase
MILFSMRVAFVIARYFPFGGAQRDFMAVAMEMSQRGHEISVITTSWEGEQPRNWHFHIIEPKTKTNHGRNRVLSQSILVLKQTQDFDCIVGFTRLLGLDVYFAADESFVATRYHGLKKWLPRYRTYAQIEFELFKSPHLKVLYLTDQQRQAYQAVHPHNQQSVVMPVCIDRRFKFDVDKYRAAREWRQTLPNVANKIVLLFVAKDFHTKGLDRVIAALGLLSQECRQHFALWVLGDGKPKQYQRQLASLQQVNVTFFGGREDTDTFYLAADYLVHPARQEAAGMVIAEALAAKLPILVSSICGYAFLAKDDVQSKILASEHIVKDLAEQLALIDSQERLERGEGSKQISYSSRAIFCADQIEAWHAL